ncbi:MAG: SMC-Scp complex subunit ScpB, partial [Bdellovibrionota bacterium]
EFIAAPMNDETFAGIEQAIAVAEKQIALELEAAAVNQAEADAERLAEQIAEDEALARAMAEEQKAELESDAELQAALPHADAEGNLDLDELQSCVEALLFMTEKPMSVDKLHELLGPDLKLSLFQEAMSALMDRYQKPHHGFELVQVAGGFQFRTKPGRAALAKKLAKIQTQRLSSGAMESLAIVAYKQPVLKDEIDKIRGVDSSHFIRGLLDKKLIRISGRSELPGRPMLYSTTPDFLELFGLKELSAMPSLRELEQMIPTSQSANPEDEDPRVKELRRLVGQMNSDHTGAIKYDPREDEKILKEIRERVGAIPTSTPYLEEQKALEKQAAQQAALGIVPAVEGAAQQPLPAQEPVAEVPVQ